MSARKLSLTLAVTVAAAAITPFMVYPFWYAGAISTVTILSAAVAFLAGFAVGIILFFIIKNRSKTGRNRV